MHDVVNLGLSLHELLGCLLGGTGSSVSLANALTSPSKPWATDALPPVLISPSRMVMREQSTSYTTSSTSLSCGRRALGASHRKRGVPTRAKVRAHVERVGDHLVSGQDVRVEEHGESGGGRTSEWSGGESEERRAKNREGRRQPNPPPPSTVDSPPGAFSHSTAHLGAAVRHTPTRQNHGQSWQEPSQVLKQRADPIPPRQPVPFEALIPFGELASAVRAISDDLLTTCCQVS